MASQVALNPLREQVRAMLQVEPRAGGFRADWKLTAELAVLPDHFPGHPIMPGICMVQAVLLGAAAARGLPDLRLRHLKNVKLMQPLYPGDHVVIDAEMSDGVAPTSDIVIKARLTSGEKRVADISLVAQIPTFGGAASGGAASGGAASGGDASGGDGATP